LNEFAPPRQLHRYAALLKSMSDLDANDPSAHFAKYDAFVDDVRKWLGTRASRFHWYYNISRIALVVLGVAVPALAAGLFGDRGKFLSPFVALLIGLVAALDALLKPGDNWQHFRSYQLALDRAKRISQSKRASLSLESDMQKYRQKQFSLYREFVLEIEELLERETRLFFEHQIQQLRESKDAA
jgi:Protein of unknown function (DUF4231)